MPSRPAGASAAAAGRLLRLALAGGALARRLLGRAPLLRLTHPEALLQRLHQVDDLRLRRRLRLGGDLLALDLLLDELEHPRLHVVLVLLRLELLVLDLLDELNRQLHLA